MERSQWERLRRRWTSASRLSEEEAAAEAGGIGGVRGARVNRGSAKTGDVIVGSRLERAVLVDMEDALETLFSRDGQFTQDIPLPQLVDILVDVWEANGNFD
jgi:hypothetical protein